MSDGDLVLVPVCGSGDVVGLQFIKSVLESEGIPCVVHGEYLQDLFGLGRMSGAYNPIVGPAQLLVRRSDVDRAKELLAGIAERGDSEAVEDDHGEPDASDT